MEPSSANKGFFQEAPVLRNQFYDDAVFQRAVKLFLPPSVRQQVEPEIAQIGDEVLADDIFTWITDAEHNQPYLKGSGRDAFGRPTSELVTGEGWRRLQEFGFAKGFVAAGYDLAYGPFNRVVQFLRLHLWEASAANVTCPSAMQDGAARLLQLQLANPRLDPARRAIFQHAFARLTSRDPTKTWTTGQWMTERTGGSDVSLTETVARPLPAATTSGQHEAVNNDNDLNGLPLGPWSISGFKWFSSATDCAMTVLLARTPQGLTAFYAPMRRPNPQARNAVGAAQGPIRGSELNGVRIQRLKHKFGTQSLPTAELELDGMRAWLIGEEGRGVHQISTVLTITRIHSAIASLGNLGRGLGVARAYARVRQVGAGRGKRMRLTDSPLHMRTLAGVTGEYRGLMLLAIFTTYVLGLEEHPSGSDAHSSAALAALTPAREDVSPLLRILTPLLKAYVCKRSITLMYACMESLGGVGYLLNEENEYLNLARLFRDMSVNAIWEGTTDVLATDFIRALKHPKAGGESIRALGGHVARAMGLWAGAASTGESGERWSPAKEWEGVKSRLLSDTQDDLLADARDLLWRVAEVMIGLLLAADCARDGNGVARQVLVRFVEERTKGETAGMKKGGLETDRGIVYGSEETSRSKL